jgi:hypothetical protein
MDKRHFIQTAPLYYALAYFSFFIGRGGTTASADAVHASFTSEARSVNTYDYLQKDILAERAIAWLEEKGLIDALRDDYAPMLLTPKDMAVVNELIQDQASPFRKFHASGWDGAWLRKALLQVNEAYDRLGIVVSDFENPAGEWEPLPLDRGNENLKKTIAQLDKLAEAVRGDNGYSATVPEERNFVLGMLESASHSLKHAATTSAPYLRTYIAEPVGILMRRFKGAATAVLAASVREALVDYLKQNAPLWIAYIFH